ncbi:ATP-binding cassette, subfamily C member [Acrasis kona]|uniref:ATP-binding cassette, subfamily C member n=1 Tax=Acrasis kona TaxID=1008807 RepID=A0AAW2ZK68_9EUKA
MKEDTFTHSFERDLSKFPLGPNNKRDEVSLLNSASFSYLDKFLFTGYKRPLEHTDVWELPKGESVDVVYPDYEAAFNKSAKNAGSDENKRNRVLLWTIHHSQKHGKLYWIGIYVLIRIICQFMDTFLLYSLLKYVEESHKYELDDPLQPSWYIGYLYSFGLFLNTIIASFCNQQAYLGNTDILVRLTGCTQHMLFKKLIKLSPESLQMHETGEIVNLCSVDAFKISEVVHVVHSLWSIPTVVIVAMILNIFYFGWATLAGVGAILIVLPCTAYIAKKLAHTEELINDVKDERVKYVNEILVGIRVIKYLCWEDNKKEQVMDARRREMSLLKKSVLLKSLEIFSVSAVSIVGSAATFLTYALSDGGDFGAAKVFTSITIFSLMVEPLFEFSWMISNAINCYTSAKRISKFMFAQEIIEEPHVVDNNEVITSEGLNTQEVDTDNLLDNSSRVEIDSVDRLERTVMKQKDQCVVFRNATFGYGDTSVLFDVDLKIKQGEFICVIGRVGSGKSTLLNSIFGDSRRQSGRLNVCGTLSYCNEKPWIINASIRDNILFGSVYIQSRYEHILRVCQLETDLKRLPNSDLTEVGENGVNLSPGQQHRISLARAAYSTSASITLLDSTLNAVDNTVQSAITKQCLVDFLHNQEKRTVILVTHSLGVCQFADRIVVLDNGRVSKIVQDYREIKQELEQEGKESIDNEARPDDENNEVPKEINQEKGKIVQDEDRQTGTISSGVVLSYLKGYGFLYLFVCVFLGVVARFVDQGRSIWLTEWSNSKDAGENAMYYLGIYSGLGGLWLILMFINIMGFGLGNLQSTNQLHSKMLDRILHARMSFFDSNPVGRILNRFTQDLFTIDYHLMQNTFFLFVEILSIVGCLLVISYVSPWFLLFVAPITIIFYFIQTFYRNTSREMRRLESVSRSPLLSHVAECARGVSTIRAYGIQKLFTSQNKLREDYYCKHYSHRYLVNRWLGIRIELVSSIVILISTFLAVYARHSLQPSLIALSVTFSLQVTFITLFVVRLMVDLESNLTSCERITNYATETPVEPVVVRDPNDVEKYYSDQATQPDQNELLKYSLSSIPEDWPQFGCITFNKVTASYRPGKDNPVLKGIELNIKTGEKIGIVGRTGAGKSTMLLTLFRFLECSSGNIEIDDLNIAHIPLKQLRSRITIIPQIPVLFSGTIRSNIDVFNEYPDQMIWNVLDRVCMKHKIENMPLKLSEPVAEQGANFSLGEQALISLSRSLLKRNKIVVFDEATANVDYESDQLIQKTIRREFDDCTTITIAHRLDTIIDSDRVVVLDAGVVVECDTPSSLLNNSESLFYKLARENGQEYFNKLKSGASK